MRRGLIDGIVWTAVGVALVAHAGVIAALGWVEPEGPGSEPGSTMLGMLVAAVFVSVGAGALYLGVRRFRSDGDRS